MTTSHRRKQVRPRKALTPLSSFHDKLRQRYVIIDPFVLEQVTHRGYSYQVKSIGDRQNTVKLAPQNNQLSSHRLSTSDDEANLSFSSEQEALRTLTEMGSPKKRPSRKREINDQQHIPRSSSPSVSSDLMIDDSNATPLRSTEDCNRIFTEIASRKRTMQLTGRPGAPINVSDQAFAQCLEIQEFEVCCFLRISPIQYYQSRDILFRNYQRQGFYKKSAAQKMLRIDVNKTGRIYDFCIENRWLPRDEFDMNTSPLPSLPKGVEQYF